MIYLFGIFIFLNSFLPKAGFNTTLLPFHLNLTDIIYLILLSFCFYKLDYKKTFKLFLPIYLIFAWGIVSFLHSYYSSVPLQDILDEFLRQYIYIFIPVIIYRLIIDEIKINILIKYFLAGLICLSLYGILQSVFSVNFTEFSRNILYKLGYPPNSSFYPDSQSPNFERITTTLLSYNSTGQYLASSIIFFLAQFFLNNKLKRTTNILIIIFIVLSTIILVLTRSRSSWIGFFASLSVFGYIILNKRFWLFPLGFAIIMSLFIFFNENINTRIKSFISLKNDFSTQVRIQAIKSSVKPFLNSPLIGHGLGTYSARKIPGDRVIFEGLDCFYVNFILTNGLLGLMIFLTPVLLVFNKSLLLFNQIKTNGFIVGTFCSLIVFLVGAFFDSMLTTSTYIIVLYWFYYGLLLRELHEHN